MSAKAAPKRSQAPPRACIRTSAERTTTRVACSARIQRCMRSTVRSSAPGISVEPRSSDQPSVLLLDAGPDDGDLLLVRGLRDESSRRELGAREALRMKLRDGVEEPHELGDVVLEDLAHGEAGVGTQRRRPGAAPGIVPEEGAHLGRAEGDVARLIGERPVDEAGQVRIQWLPVTLLVRVE